MKSDKTTPNVPTLRFAEFSDLWEHKQFDEVLLILANNTLSRAELNYDNGDYKDIHYGDVLIKYPAYIDVSSTDVPYINTENSSTKLNNALLQNGDVVIADTAEDFTVGKATEIENVSAIKVVAGLHTIPCRPKMRFSPKYLGYYINSPAYHDQLVPFIQGVKVSSISKTHIRKTYLSFSSLLEQEKIANFLSCLDEKIKAQNKIIEDLKVLKKELCAKLFGSPLCGRIIAIEQVADIYGGYAFNSKAYVNKGKYKIVTIGNVTGDKYISGNYNTIDRLPNNIQKPQVLSKGDILVSLTGNVGRISIVDGDEYLLNQRVAKLGIEDDLTKEYIYQYLSNSSFEKDMINAGQGAAQKNIKNQDILSYCIRFPTDQTALENIDKLLSLYDMRITSEKAILSNLILQKSYYLRAMFI